MGNDVFNNELNNLTIYGVAGSYAEEYADEYGIPFVAGDLPDGSCSIYGDVTAYGDISSEISIQLLNGENVQETQTAVGNSGSYSFEDVVPGTYTLRVSKSKHCTRDYTVTVTDGDVEQNVEIWLYGDVNGDGSVDNMDVFQMNRYIAHLSSIFTSGNEDLQAYRYKVANVMAIVGSDDTLDNMDVFQVNRYIAHLSSVFDSL